MWELKAKALMRLIAPFAVMSSTLLGPFDAHAQDDEQKLPLARAVLFASGVGYFEHVGEIEGDEHVDLQFSQNDVNDLLKSLVVEDLNGGVVTAVTYDSREPLSRTLGAFAIDLTSGATMANLLRQVRGHSIALTLDDQTKLEGRIVNVETRPTPVGDQVIQEERLILKTGTGLRSVALRSAVEFRLLDERLEEDFQKALDVLAAAQSTDKKSIRLQFRGQGKRTARIGYIQEFPVWKTTYRLVLSPDSAPFLQGWAIVENLTERDWSDVQLALVSGRPISFVMDLHQPLYLTRPSVAPNVLGSPRPQLYDQDLMAENARSQVVGTLNGKPVRMPSTHGNPFGGAGGMGGGFGGGGGGGGYGGGQAKQLAQPAAKFDLRQGAAQLAETGDLGELFRYTIKSPVSLPRRKSAMLPIVNAEIDAEKVSIFNPDVHAKHPLAGLKLKNTTELHLTAGPITVFDEGDFAGDARIAETAPRGERLVSYALDLDREVATTAEEPTRTLAMVKIASGLGQATYRWTRSRRYLIKSSGDQAKRLLIEQPIDEQWELKSPAKPEEKTRSLYRFSIEAPANTTTVLEIVEERHSTEEFALAAEEFGLDATGKGQWAIYLNSEAASGDVRRAMEKVSELKAELAKAKAELRQTTSELSDITKDQSRIRENMQVLAKSDPLYQRYVKTFTEQEEQFQSLRQQVLKQRQAVEAAEARLKSFVEDLNVD